MEKIVLVAMFAATLALTVRSVRWTYLMIYLPFLFLVPQGFELHWVGLPELSFGTAALIPVIGALVIKRLGKWRPSVVDLFILLLVVWAFSSETTSVDLKKGIQALFIALATIWAPYYMAKHLIEGVPSWRVRVARMLVLLMFINLLIIPYELLSGENFYHRLLDSFFPGQWEGSYGSRFGIHRWKSVFATPIFLGMVAIVMFRLSRWLEWRGLWEKRFVNGIPLPINKGRIMSWSMMLMAAAALSRGPWLAGLGGALLVWIGRGKRIKFRMITVIVLLVAGGILGYSALKAYSISDSERTHLKMALTSRLDLYQDYWPVISEKKWLGWGITNYPRHIQLDTVDNFYIFHALTRGLVGLMIFVGLQLWQLSRLSWRCFWSKHTISPGGSFLFTLIGIHLIIDATIYTVYMDTFLYQMFFMIIGWTEGYLRVGEDVKLAAVPKTLQTAALPVPAQ